MNVKELIAKLQELEKKGYGDYTVGAEAEDELGTFFNKYGNVEVSDPADGKLVFIW